MKCVEKNNWSFLGCAWMATVLRMWWAWVLDYAYWIARSTKELADILWLFSKCCGLSQGTWHAAIPSFVSLERARFTLMWNKIKVVPVEVLYVYLWLGGWFGAVLEREIHLDSTWSLWARPVLQRLRRFVYSEIKGPTGITELNLCCFYYYDTIY